VKNEVELMGVYGNDEIHALSAWTSTNRQIGFKKRSRIGKLLKMLASEGHMTPFEKSSLHFLVTTDIATHIHLLKHRVGVSINAESARYKEFKINKYYLPTDWPEDECKELEGFITDAFDRYHKCIARLEGQGYDRKRAKESARLYLPYGIQITCDIMFNWRSFAHFQKLRNDEHAQLEVREVAAEMLNLVDEQGDFPLTIEAMEAAGMLPIKQNQE
jgi:thymidylate synthase (FAD)